MEMHCLVGYRCLYSPAGPQAGETMKKFEEIRQRGRKRTMLGWDSSAHQQGGGGAVGGRTNKFHPGQHYLKNSYIFNVPFIDSS